MNVASFGSFVPKGQPEGKVVAPLVLPFGSLLPRGQSDDNNKVVLVIASPKGKRTEGGAVPFGFAQRATAIVPQRGQQLRCCSPPVCCCPLLPHPGQSKATMNGGQSKAKQRGSSCPLGNANCVPFGASNNVA